MTQLDKLLDQSISQHGYWLINNKDAISSDLNTKLDRVGFSVIAGLLDNIDSTFCKDIYKKIKESRA